MSSSTDGPDTSSREIVFVCPETHQQLRLASVRELEAIREAIRENRASRGDGLSPPTSFEAAYVTEQREYAYLVVDGVPNFLLSERLELSHCWSSLP